MPICRSCFCLHIHLLASDWTLTQSLLLLTSVTAGMGQAPFWVAVIGGLTIIKTIRQVAEGRGVLDNKDAKYIPQSEEQIAELKVFACAGCGYEMMPARGREGKFFPDDFKCPICGADKDQFWDMNDPNDPRNQEKEDEGKENRDGSNLNDNSGPAPRPPA